MTPHPIISKLQAASLRYSVREGNFSSYVYVGGLPTWYYGMHAHADSRRPLLALPTALLEPRFRGAIRDLRYKDVVSRQVTVQDMVAYKVRVKSTSMDGKNTGTAAVW